VPPDIHLWEELSAGTAQLPETADPVDRIEMIAVRHGFEPRRAERRSSVDLVLCRCPYEATATAAPDIVCQLHLGLAEGMAQASGDSVSVTGLVARDPRRAGCRLTMARSSEAGATGGSPPASMR
jgi:hypothetical protein